MPHYYFDLVENGQVMRDEDGLVLDDLEAAKGQARRALADVVREEIMDGSPPPTTREVAVHIRDHEVGPVILRVLYSVDASHG